MSISILLDKSIEENLRHRLQQDRISISDFIREAIHEKLFRDAPPMNLESIYLDVIAVDTTT